MVDEKEEFEKWFELADRDLRTAKNSLKSGDYYASVFWCQQSIEKGLKALWLKRGNELIRTHDLVVLGKNVDLSEEYFLNLDEISKAYISSRYSLMIGEENSGESFDKEDVQSFIKISEDVLEWIKKRM